MTFATDDIDDYGWHDNGPEPGETALVAIRNGAPCLICTAPAATGCAHKEYAKRAVIGDDGAECRDCGMLWDLRGPHACDSESK